MQYPDNAQSYNRYTYVNNNPLSYTDPSGHFSIGKFFKRAFGGVKKILKNPIVRTAVGLAAGYFAAGYVFSAYSSSAIAAAGNVISQAQLSSIFLTGKVLAGAAGGFVAGVISSGTLKGGLIGGVTGSLFAYAGVTLPDGPGKILAHGLIGGVRAELTGGRFSRGFFSQAISKAATIFSTGLKDFGKGVVSIVAGGAASVAAGGKFVNGAVTAAYGYLFNQLLSKTYKVFYSRDEDQARAYRAGLTVARDQALYACGQLGGQNCTIRKIDTIVFDESTAAAHNNGINFLKATMEISVGALFVGVEAKNIAINAYARYFGEAGLTAAAGSLVDIRPVRPGDIVIQAYASDSTSNSIILQTYANQGASEVIVRRLRE